jgi:ABC-type multidrug transport system ATPase subunit
MLMYTDSKFIIIPKSTLTEAIIAPPFNYFWTFLDSAGMGHYETQYCDTVEEMEELVYSSDATGLAIKWDNLEQPDGITHPKIEFFEQSLMTEPLGDVVSLLRQGLSAYLLQNRPDMAAAATIILSTNYSIQEFASVSTTEFFEIQIAIVFFAIVPAILAIMPDFQTILEEKDNKVAAFTFLMGCSETAYWLVAFLMPFLLCVIPYLLFGAILCFWFGMIGTDYSMFLVICYLFVISHIWFIFFLSTFMVKGSTGRSITILLLILTSFFGFLHQYFTLDESNSSGAIKHVFSIVPLSAFELTLMAMYTEAMNNQPPLTWGTANRDIVYPPATGMMWLAIDAAAYFVLFLFFNLMNRRQFGTPMVGWRCIFDRDTWLRMFRDDNADIGDVHAQVNEFLEVIGLGKTYKSGQKDTRALDDVNFVIKPGEVIVVIGPNGAGKSTLINIIAGAIEPTEGRMRLMGSDPTNRFKEIQRYLGIVFQENVIIPLLSVREHMYMFGAFRGIPMDVLEESMEFFAHTLQLTEMMNNRAGDLSGGQKRKLCIALSLLGNPPIVIMDEPTAGVDVQARQLIWKTIAGLDGTTSLITSHALEEAEAVSSRLFIVSKGKVPFCGTSTELRNRFKCGYLLRIVREDGTAGKVLELAQSFVSAAHLVEDRKDTIAMPVDDAVPQFLTELSERLDEYDVTSYSFAVEQLEDMLLKLIQSDEAAYQTPG